MTDNQTPHAVAVIGAGPAGLYAAKQFASNGATVALINRDIKLGGLAEYGIFHNKHKMKNGLRNQFRQLMDEPGIHYFGNVVVGGQKDLSLDDLRQMGFSAIMVTVGAQDTKWLGLPGEEYKGVYHAKDLVYHYNQLPPFSQKDYPIGERVVIVGVGNVMMDLAQYTIRDLKVKQVTSVARRGPADVKFTKKEMSYVIKNLDQEALEAEIQRTAPVMEAVNQDPQAAKDFILSSLGKGEEPVSDTKFLLKFLMQPKQILGNEEGRVTGLEVENTSLELRADGVSTKSIGLGATEVLECETVIFCIGDRVDQDFGLPLDKWKEFAKNPKPRFPENDLSYEAYDPEKDEAVEDVFLAGWAREASSGLVGVARKDGESGARAMLAYLETLPPAETPDKAIQALEEKLKHADKPVVTKMDWQKLDQFEQQKAEELGQPYFKFSSNEEMLKAIGLLETA
jgi:ferredoxin--NADP+ reductase